MFLHLAHSKLAVFKVSKMFVLECYRITNVFPAEEKFALVQQIRRAALSVHLNIAEGCSRKSLAERKRFEISRDAVIEVDTAFDIAYALNYRTQEDITAPGEHLIKTFKILSGLISSEKLTADHSPLA